jgi:DtxR family transcriptional regulator, Mn-dependent transcriptional regulator
MDAPISKSERELLKAVYRLSKGGSDAHTGALSEHLGIAPGTVTTTVKRLAERGLVDHRPYRGVELTQGGRQLAVAAIRRHRIVERFLSDTLGYAWHEADRLAGAFEHELPAEVEERLYEVLGRPATCPHGFPIPGQEVDSVVQLPSLNEMEPGQSGIVAVSGSTERDIVEFLDTLGIRPGAHLEVISKQPFDGPIAILVEGHEQTVGERLAQRIFVKVPALFAVDNPGRPETEPVDARNLDLRWTASRTSGTGVSVVGVATATGTEPLHPQLSRTSKTQTPTSTSSPTPTSGGVAGKDRTT